MADGLQWVNVLVWHLRHHELSDNRIVKYQITVTAEGLALGRPRTAAWLVASDALRFARRHWGILAALAFTLLIHAPTLRYFFEGDDFVVLGNIEGSGTRAYLLDTLRMQEVVPNWRPLTAVVYATEWHLFGMNATAWRSVNLGVHLASVAMLYMIVLRTTRRPAIGAIAALIFGVSGAHVDTVTYITALPHVLATFFVLSSLLAIIAYAQDGERNHAAFALSAALFALAFLANEGAFVYAPLLVAAYAGFSHRWSLVRPMRLAVHAAPFVALASGWLAFYQSCACEQIKFNGYSWGGHVFEHYALYLSWLAYPAHAIPLHPDGLRWTLAAVVVAVGLVVAAAGPRIAAVGALGVALALLPFVPVEVWTASRYSYGAAAFFAPVAAIAAYWLYERMRALHVRARLPAAALALALVATVAALYAWQSYAQDSNSGRRTDRWQLLVNELQANYESVPPGTTIWIVDGPWTSPMEQYTWVPGVARALYGDAAAFDLPAGAYAQEQRERPRALYLRWTGSALVPVTQEQVVEGAR